MDIFGIVGAGIMGNDLAIFFAESGYRVLLNDIDPYRLDTARGKIHDRLSSYERRGRLDADRMADLESRVEFAESLDEFSRADIVIECVTEDLEIKKGVFAELDGICRPGVVLASNTSSKSITAIAAATRRAESVIGLHFMNPVRAMRLVEIICGLATTRETFETVKQIVKKAGKEYVESRD